MQLAMLRPDLLDVLLLEPGGSKFLNFRKKKKLTRDSYSRVPKMVDSLWLGVKVVCGSRVLFGSKIVNCSKEETFGNLISRIQEEQFSERRVKRFGHVTFF